MTKRPRYSVQKYILLIVISATAGLVITTILLSLIGFPRQGLLVVVIFCFPVFLFACLKGFYKGLVNHYGFKEPEFHEDVSSEHKI